LQISDCGFTGGLHMAERPIKLLCFLATWDANSYIMKPLLNELLIELQDIVDVVQLDVDADSDVARRFRITTTPSLLVLQNGIEVARTLGRQSKSEIKCWVESFVH
jgi:thioredoxin 1